MTSREGFARLARTYAAGRIDAMRKQGKSAIALRVGDLRDEIRELLPDAGIPESNDDVMDICQVMETRKFHNLAGVRLIGQEGPQSGAGTVYYFRIIR